VCASSGAEVPSFAESGDLGVGVGVGVAWFAVTETLLVAGSFTAIIAVAQWVAVYTVLEPWWRHPIGRSLVTLAAFATVTPALFILSLLFDLNRATSQLLAWIEIVLLFAYLPALGWRSLIWIRTARRARRAGV